MRRVLWVLLLGAFMLGACGGPAADLTTVPPPQATSVESTGNAEIDQILATWKESVPQAMVERQVRGDTIQQNVYQTTESLEAVANYYGAQFNSSKGWVASSRTPGLQPEQGLLISGYEHGTISLIVGAIDATKYGGTGVVVYTATGNI